MGQSCSGISEVEIHMPVIYTTMTEIQCIHGTFFVLHVYWLVQVLRESSEEEVESSMTPELPADEEPPLDGEIPDLAEISMDGETWVTGNIERSETVFANFDCKD